MRPHARSSILIVLSVCFLAGCDLTEPNNRTYNKAAHPPDIGGLDALGIPPGEGLAGSVFISVDTAIGIMDWGRQTILVDSIPISVSGYWFGGNTFGFDTHAFPDGVHTLTVGVMKSGSTPRETGLLGYLGVADMLFTGQVVFKQTSPFDLPVNAIGERPAVDATRNLLYVMERDSVKALSTLTNTVLRSRRWNSTSYPYNAWGQIALSPDGTRLYVYSGDLGPFTQLLVLNALTFDSLARAPVNFPVTEILCGSGNRLYVASSSGVVWLSNGILRVLDNGSLGQISELALPIASPMKMVMPDDRKTLFLASNGVCRVAIESATPVLLRQKATDQVDAIGISPDGQRLFLFFNKDIYSVTYKDRLTVANPSTLDSTDYVPLDPLTLHVRDLLPTAQHLFVSYTAWTGSETGLVGKYSGLHTMTASWVFNTSAVPAPLQVSGDGRYLYGAGGSLCIPLP